MGKVLVSESSLSAIADAIRVGVGGSNTYKPADMPAAVAAACSCSAWEVAAYSATIVGVSDPSLTSTCYGLQTISSLAGYATLVGQYAFSSCSKLTSVSLPNCISVGDGAFSSCSSLTSLELPNCTSVGNDAFSGCSSLTSLELPNCTSVGNDAFSSCLYLTSLELPNCTSVGSYAFSSCSNLTSLYLLSPTLCTAEGPQVFSGLQTSIYVPSALLTAYNQAPYWSEHVSRFIGV